MYHLFIIDYSLSIYNDAGSSLYFFIFIQLLVYSSYHFLRQLAFIYHVVCLLLSWQHYDVTIWFIVKSHDLYCHSLYFLYHHVTGRPINVCPDDGLPSRPKHVGSHRITTPGLSCCALFTTLIYLSI